MSHTVRRLKYNNFVDSKRNLFYCMISVLFQLRDQHERHYAFSRTALPTCFNIRLELTL